MKFIGEGNYSEYLICPLKKNNLLFSFSIIGIFIGLLNIFLGQKLDISNLAVFSGIWFFLTYFLIFTNDDDISFFFKIRFFLISILPFLESLLVSIDPDIHIASLFTWLITIDMRLELITAGIFASSAVIIGWYTPYFLKINIPKLRIRNYLSLNQVSLFCLFLGLILFFADGGLLTQNNVYGSKKTFDIGIGVFNIFQAFCLSYLIIYPLSFERKKKYFFIQLAAFLLGPLSGSRADFILPISIILLFLFTSIKNNKSTLKIKIRSKSFISKLFKILTYFIFLILIYFSLIFIGIYRANPDIGFVLEKFEITNLSDLLFSQQNYGKGFRDTYTGLKILNLETAGPIINSFYGGILAKPFENFPELGLSSYLNWFKNLLPRFFGIERVPGLEYFLNPYVGDTFGVLTFTQGGVHEISEAYLNFGFYGSFIIPFLWSAIFSSFEKNIINKKEINFRNFNIIDLNAFISIVFLLMSFRGIFYQNFTYFRTLTILILILPFVKRIKNEFN